MDLEQKAAKVESAKWNKEHTSFTATCPGSNGTKHLFAVSESRTVCLGQPRCSEELISTFFANGTARAKPAISAPKTEIAQRAEPLDRAHHLTLPTPAVIPDITSWRLKLQDLGNQIFGKAESPRLLAATTRDELIEGLLTDYRNAIKARISFVCPIPEQSETDREEDLYKVAEVVVDAFQKEWAQLPAVQDGRAVATTDYADRLAVDAFEAYSLMVGEAREYSWEGLIRDGCTAVLSALIGAGKSTFSMNLARAWGLGVPFLDRQCRQSRTLVVVSPKEYEAWAETIGFWKLKGAVFLVESTKAHFGSRDQTVTWFDFLMKKHECRTFVLDTLFDFFGMPPNNSGDSNRIAMNEQTPLLQMARERNYSGLVTGHAPKSEAKAIDPRDPEESFGGHTAWTAQHRMRMTIRRKSQGINAFVTGRGGYGDKGILKEELLLFEESTRIDSLGGLFADHLGRVAMPSVVECLTQLGRPAAISQLVKEMDKGEKWIRPGLKEARKQGVVVVEGKGRSTRYRLASQESDQGDLPISDANPTYTS